MKLSVTQLRLLFSLKFIFVVLFCMMGSSCGHMCIHEAIPSHPQLAQQSSPPQAEQIIQALQQSLSCRSDSNPYLAMDDLVEHRCAWQAITEIRPDNMKPILLPSSSETWLGISTYVSEKIPLEDSFANRKGPALAMLTMTPQGVRVGGLKASKGLDGHELSNELEEQNDARNQLVRALEVNSPVSLQITPHLANELARLTKEFTQKGEIYALQPHPSGWVHFDSAQGKIHSRMYHFVLANKISYFAVFETSSAYQGTFVNLFPMQTIHAKE